eukprot:TRINITY_DN11207_c0_g1_i1.p1 TRINITY_DN11207_c0_g1~~TRINITY_DN11207_c0_g1_i1.p1  ORF type:complete len:363 (+),score=72.94 TRINITY_DN11207_c0_g1_i1:57-1145(+)
MTSINRLAVSISAHAWNGAKNQVAVCPNTNEIMIYSWNGSQFSLLTTLTDHDAIVTCIDWAPNSNRILSCSQDRNGYVWEYDGTTWQPTLVILRINRAATYCVWSPKEDKFAVGTGDCVVAVCYFEADNNWWVSKHIKKEITSTVLAITWHPNNILIACGGTDKAVRVFSGFVKQCDNKKDVAAGTAFGKKLPFGALLATYEMNSWILDCQFSPDGNQLAWTCHDSTFHVLDCPTEDRTLNSINHNFLPVRSLIWVNDRSVIGAGYDCQPILFQNSGSWTTVGSIDNKPKQAKKTSNARAMFENMVDKGQNENADVELDSRHQNSISVIRNRNDGTFSTSGLDGNVVVWSLDAQAREANVTF